MIVESSWPLCVPVVSDGDVTLRAHTSDDLPGLVEMCNDDLMARFTTIPVPYGPADAEAFVFEHLPTAWSNGRREWAIEMKDPDSGQPRFAGNVALDGGPVAELSFALHPAARGQMVMTRAAAMAIDWGFTVGGIEVVRWNAIVGNLGSLRVAHALGFRLCGRWRSSELHHGEPVDLWMGSLSFGDAPIARTKWLSSTLESNRLRLRPLRVSDADRITESGNDPQNRHWMAYLPRPFTAAHGRDLVHDAIWNAARGTQASWAICRRDSDELLGMVAVANINGDHEVSYWMHPDSRGNGFMTETLNVVADHALDDAGLGAHSLVARVAASNIASNAVATAAGFARAGLLHRNEPLGDGTRDDLMIYERYR